MSSISKPTLDVPLGSERIAALKLLADRWTLWLVLAIHERDGARFSDLAAEPGLSRRVLADRLPKLVDAGMLERVRYGGRPLRHRYALTERGLQVRRLALALVHVGAGGQLSEDPLRSVEHPVAGQVEPATGHEHPADRLLAADRGQAERILAETVEPVIRYDEQYRTSFFETLAAYLASDASVSVTAARMHAHRHTIRYRLGRVQELTGLAVDSAEDRERLALGVRAARMLG